MIDDLIEEHEYAKLRGVAVRTLQRERARGVSARFIKIGRRIFYRKEAISEWLLSKEQAAPRGSREH